MAHCDKCDVDFDENNPDEATAHKHEEEAAGGEAPAEEAPTEEAAGGDAPAEEPKPEGE